MNAKALKKLLKDVPDNTIILVPGSDHSYRRVMLFYGTALQEDRGTYTEDYGESVTPEAECGKRIQALIVA